MKEIKLLLGIIVILAVAWFSFDKRYAHASEVAKIHLEIKKDMIVSEIRQLSAKEKTVGLVTWEKLRKEDLERQFENLTKEK